MAPPRQGPPAPGQSQPGPFPARKPAAPATAAPTPPPPPPPAAPKNQSTGAAYNAYINAHPIMRAYADQIWKWAGVYGIDKVVAATLFWKEGFAAAQASGQDPATITSPTGAGVGPGQINPNHVGSAAPWGTLHQTDLVNPAKNIQWSMWFFAQQISKFGDADTAYSQGYNPGYTGPSLTSGLPKSYVPRSGLSPTDQGTVSAETANATAAAKTVLNDRWAVLGADGKVKFTKINDPNTPPKNVLKYGPTPLTQTSFIQTWKQTYQDSFFAFTGRQASGKEISQILANAPSIYTLQNQLAGSASFINSPTYKAHAPGIIEIAKQSLGGNWKVDKTFVAQAIAQDWDQATLTAKIRALPAYVNGPEFQDTVAKLSNVYQQIYGQGDVKTAALIATVGRQGWTSDQFAAWLRTQPEYQGSQEYKSKALTFATNMGLFTGQLPTLTAEQAMLGPPPAAPQETAPASTTPAMTAPPVVVTPPSTAGPPIQGERKNQPPFTRPVVGGR